MSQKGLFELLEELIDAVHELAREQQATRAVLRYWMNTLVEKEAPINVDVDISKLDELEQEIKRVKTIALTSRR